MLQDVHVSYRSTRLLQFKTGVASTNKKNQKQLLSSSLVFVIVNTSHDCIATDVGTLHERHTASRFPRRRRRCVVWQRLPRQRRRAEGVPADDELYLVSGRASDEWRHLVAVHVFYLRTVYLQFTHVIVIIIISIITFIVVIIYLALSDV